MLVGRDAPGAPFVRANNNAQTHVGDAVLCVPKTSDLSRQTGRRGLRPLQWVPKIGEALKQGKLYIIIKCILLKCSIVSLVPQ